MSQTRNYASRVEHCSLNSFQMFLSFFSMAPQGRAAQLHAESRRLGLGDSADGNATFAAVAAAWAHLHDGRALSQAIYQVRRASSATAQVFQPMVCVFVLQVAASVRELCAVPLSCCSLPLLSQQWAEAIRDLDAAPPRVKQWAMHAQCRAVLAEVKVLRLAALLGASLLQADAIMLVVS